MVEWLIAGLGNPGSQYRDTRHNAGFKVVDALATATNSMWAANTKFKAEVAESGTCLLVKPQTFMNLSGEAIGALARYYRIPPERIVVIHDDLDLSMGVVKAGLAKGPKVHHGLQSVEQGLGTADFWRVRVGVDERSAEERFALPGEQYVLKPLSQTERDVLAGSVRQAAEKVHDIIGA